jgi:hypothetical protein
MLNPPNTILEVSMMYAVSRCLHVIAEMGVADALGDDPRTAVDLAETTGANSDAVARALRVVSAYGIFERRNDGSGHTSFTHTPASRLLRTDHPQSMRSFVRMLGNTVNWQSLGLLAHSMRTGEPATEQVIPGGSWTYYAQHPEESRIFDEAMVGKAHGQIAGILAGYDFSPFKTIADIGGGRGHLLNAVLAATPDATGVLFDQPHVVKDAAGTASARLEIRGGDFFKDTLPVCDAYLIMQVIHDWNDREAIQILSSIRRSAPTYAKLLLIEGILPEDSTSGWIEMANIFMLALMAGRERTRREFETLLNSSGFRLDKVIDVGLGTSILEASVI